MNPELIKSLNTLLDNKQGRMLLSATLLLNRAGRIWEPDNILKFVHTVEGLAEILNLDSEVLLHRLGDIPESP